MSRLERYAKEVATGKRAKDDRALRAILARQRELEQIIAAQVKIIKAAQAELAQLKLDS